MYPITFYGKEAIMIRRIDNSANGFTVEQIGSEIQEVLNELDQVRGTHPVLKLYRTRQIFFRFCNDLGMTFSSA